MRYVSKRNGVSNTKQEAGQPDTIYYGSEAFVPVKVTETMSAWAKNRLLGLREMRLSPSSAAKSEFAA